MLYCSITRFQTETTTHRVFFETNGGDRFVHIAAHELVDRGWITLIDTTSDRVETVPTHAVNRLVLDLDERDHIDGKNHGMTCVIHFVDGARADVDGVAVALVYEIREGWLLYVDAMSGTAELCPAHTVATIKSIRLGSVDRIG